MNFFMKAFLRFPFFKKTNGEIMLALDIGTKWVKALIFTVEEANKNEIIPLGFGRAKYGEGGLSNGLIINSEIVASSVEKAFFTALKDLKKKPEPQRGVLGFGGSIVKSEIINLKIHRERFALEISDTEMMNIFQKVQWQSFDKVKKEYFGGAKLEILDARILRIAIDGYQISNPVGFKGKEIELSFLNVFSSKEVIMMIENIVSQLNLNFQIISESYASIAAMQGAGDRKSGIFIDIGADSTDISITRNGYLSGIKNFSFGGRNFTKRLAKLLEINEIEAENVKLKYAENKLAQRAVDKIKNVLAKDMLIWRKGVALSLEEFSKDIVLPSTVLLGGGGAFLPGIKESLLDPVWFQNLSFVTAPNISILYPRNIAGVNDRDNILETVTDAMPILLASNLFILKNEDPSIAKLKKRAMKLLSNRSMY